MHSDSTNRVSQITLPDPYWRYLILFQSWTQLLSWAVAMAGVIGTVWLLIWLFGDHRLILGTLPAALVGGTPSLLFVGKARFSVSATALPEQAAAAAVLDEWNYVAVRGAGQDKQFRQKLPSWLRWTESEVTIGKRDGVIVYTGPRLLIRFMRKAALSAARQAGIKPAA
ncbi:hypothetical protein IP92_04464 [Pseudoduganella flava]|uniref:DUF2244 domain-containing protein n=1 Tax=Pseudoduganella flava TaxID=871742 RepID=A0A562PJ99_9BURK|nr:hypothetical protein [Pseudoduganella flava]QGZ42084.1 hypothetical protein GO485_25580 [Pseudoduganella flava]TWI44514.1 hypothetical protein IP92_04464 [Pseudoduganella flava]